MSLADLTDCLIPSIVVLRPPPDLTVSQWADQHRMLSSEASLEAGRWSTSRAEYQRGIMDAVCDPSVRQIVVMTSAQVGKTEILLNIIGYFIDQDPSPILALQPTVEMAEAFSKDRLAPMLRDSPCLRGKVADPRTRDSGNTTLHKRFPGGHVTLAGANSPASLASRPIRVVLCDEVDRYPLSAGSEGDPVSLAIKRSSTWWNRVVVLTSTPTVKGNSRIELAYLQSDRRRYFVPCGHCGHEQTMEWERVVRLPDSLQEAAYACESCGTLWSEGDRLKSLLRGSWRATAPFTGVAGFHLSELYSGWRTIADVARDYDSAKGDPETHRVWVNTSLGLPYEEVGERAETDTLRGRAEDYGAEVPDGVSVLTAGIDVQGDRLELEIVGWGEGEESWSIAYEVLPGQPSEPDVWHDLSELLGLTWSRADGLAFSIAAAGIDAGYLPRKVYEFCAAHRGQYVWPLKGRAGAWPLVESGMRRAKRVAATAAKGKIRPFLVGVDEAKLALYRRIARVAVPGPGYVHVPIGRDEEWFLQLTAEQWVRGVWQKIRPRNEGLDCRVYAHAALKLLHPAGVPVVPGAPPAVVVEAQRRMPQPPSRQSPPRPMIR